ncbi:MAG: NrfD/PsrC family molybdoenzyme membrane anchor subunit, partial [Thiothrix sp.]
MASQSITFRETRESKGFFFLLAVLGVFLVLGALAFFHNEHHGHHVTGMNNQIVWGLPHVFAIFLIVAASGALNIGSIGTVFGKKIYQPMGRLSALVAMSLLVGGLIVLVLDLGRPDRLIIAMTHYNFKSIFAWNIILYNGFLALSAIYVWTMMDRHAKGFYKMAGVAAFTWRLILTTGTGSIFGFLVARDFYNSAVMAPLFIAMSFAFGLAVFILVLYFAYTWTDRPLGDAVLNRLRYLLATFIGGVLLLELARYLTGLYSAQRTGVTQFVLFEGGTYTQLFWVGQIMLGSLLPLSLIFCRRLANNHVALLLAAGFTVLGG